MMSLLLLATLAAPPPDGVALSPAAAAAVVAAVRARMGEGADVVVERVETLSPLDREVADAVLLPGATIGGPVEVVLRGIVDDGGTARLTPVGRARLRVQVTAPHLHAARAVSRGTRLSDGDLAPARHVLPRGALKALPDADWLADGRVLRDLPEGACLTARVVAPSPAVVAGQDVTAVVREGGVEVRATLVAVDSGAVGDEVRVMHRESRRTLRARVAGRAEVEIRHDP
jgi:flagella basal body P-ring formation protein FlgA